VITEAITLLWYLLFVGLKNLHLEILDVLAECDGNSVLLFRIDGKGNKTAYRIDLTKKALFDSPYYYLQQNDVIYVEPNRTKSRESRYSPNLSILISAISTAISAATLIYTLTK
jgi:polysaccharide export outer membrane protein